MEPHHAFMGRFARLGVWEKRLLRASSVAFDRGLLHRGRDACKALVGGGAQRRTFLLWQVGLRHVLYLFLLSVLAAPPVYSILNTRLYGDFTTRREPDLSRTGKEWSFLWQYFLKCNEF